MGNPYQVSDRDQEPQRHRAQRAFGCEGKQSYPSKKVARGVLRAMRKRVNTGDTLGAYDCPVCRRWHLGNSEKNRRANRES